MPFEFAITKPDGSKFSCDIHSRGCEAHRRDGQRCDRKVHFGSLCTKHLKGLRNLVIQRSRIRNSGLGLFASGHRNPVFRRGSLIIEYAGELINDHEMKRRYGELTAPYGVGLTSENGSLTLDGACLRGPGAFANHATGLETNADLLVMPGSTKRIGVYAKRDIEDGEEIFIDYGPSYEFDSDHTTVRKRRGSSAKRPIGESKSQMRRRQRGSRTRRLS